MHFLVKLAKTAVEKFAVEKKYIQPQLSAPSRFLKEKSGVFVTIKKDGELRGCIGTYLPTKESIAQEIIHNAVEAATNDPRFGPVTPEELPNLSYEVYILGKPEQIDSIGSLDPKKYGVIVCGTKSRSTGLLLPDLEGIDNVNQQLSIACQKAGIDPGNEKISIFRFAVEKYS